MTVELELTLGRTRKFIPPPPPPVVQAFVCVNGGVGVGGLEGTPLQHLKTILPTVESL